MYTFPFTISLVIAMLAVTIFSIVLNKGIKGKTRDGEKLSELNPEWVKRDLPNRS